MPLFLKDIGSSADLTEQVATAIATKHGELFIVLDKARTVRIIRAEHKDEELDVQCSDDTDVNDKATIILHLPYAADSVAQAMIISYKEGA
jgi:hypothetical protein